MRHPRKRVNREDRVEIRLGGGVVVDLATGDDVRDAVNGGVRDALARQSTSTIRRDSGSVNTGAGANGTQYVIPCITGAARGRIIDIRNVAVVALDANGQPFLTGVTAVAMLIIGPHQPGTGNAPDFDPSSIASEPFAVPGARAVGRGALVLNEHERLYVWIKLTGALPNTTFVAAYTAVEGTITSDLMEDL